MTLDTFRRRPILLVAGIALLGALLSIIVQLLGDSGNDRWTTDRVADRVLAEGTGGCPPTAAEPQTAVAVLNSPVRAQIENKAGDTCALISGAPIKFPPEFKAPSTRQMVRDVDGNEVSVRPLNKAGDLLMVSIAEPAHERSGWWWLPAALICFLASTATGAAVMLVRPRADVPAPERGEETMRREHVEHTESARPVELPALTTSGVSGLTVDRGRSGRYDVYAATQVGLSHAKDGNTREDAYAIGGDPDRGWVYLAVADGLGSAANSHAAAQRATRTCLTLLHRYASSLDRIGYPSTWEPLAAEITAKVAAQLDAGSVDGLAAELDYRSPHGAGDNKRTSIPACTLAFAALGPVSADGYPLAWATVGDCDLLLVDLNSGATKWLTQHATKRGMISNVTPSLPRDADRVIAGFTFVPSNLMVVLASDGMADAIRLVPEQFATLLPQIAGPRPAEHVFGQLVGFDLPGLHDDRTIVAAWPTRGRGPARERR
ncbi:protein phosphatase 2C domain-containing protein [Nocardia pseudovaccinii]|uniref:protein phosphatase 2C domain-containing protein n=1 Tax=Nocardia pseudovaccinii TaxID=189540 RepID=UPI000A004D0E|nr:protein phosphatase 2C domain-containing protein [Nocardia pseudovaccinii]